MGEKKRLSTQAVVCMLLLMLWLMAVPAPACPPDGKECSNCIVDRMNSGCPSCVPIMRCMARCLWGSGARGKCSKKCDCNIGGYPRLSDCKKCLSQCKCSCAV